MKKNNSNRNNSGAAGKAVSNILKSIVFVVVIVILIFICMAILKGDYSVGTYINNAQITGYDTEEGALSQSTFLSFSDTCVVAFDSNDLQGISITLDGQSNGTSLYASTEAYQVAQSFGLAEITVGDDGSFSFNVNSNFEVSEIVLMTINYNGSENGFGSETTTKYFAFAVGESTETTESGGTTIDTTNSDANTDMAASVYFNGVTVATYDSRETAVQNCERSHNTEFDIYVEPNGVDRVIVSTYTYDPETDTFHQNTDEKFIYDGNDWSTHINLSEHAGQIIVVKIRLEATSDEILTGNRFFAISIEETEEVDVGTETDADESEEPAETTDEASDEQTSEESSTESSEESSDAEGTTESEPEESTTDEAIKSL